MAYVKQNWENLPSTNTPITAERLNHMEDGIYEASQQGGGTTGSVDTGIILPFAGSDSSIPSGYLLCDGSAVSRTDYADLFAVIGTNYGTGDGSTTFNLPSLKGRIVVGLDSDDTDFDSIGATGGEKQHTLTVDEIPSHNHTAGKYDNLGIGNLQAASGSNMNALVAMGSSATTRITTNATGGGQAHNVLQPYIVMNYIIKY